MSDAPETVRIPGSDGAGYDVPADLVDFFFDGADGTPLSDAKWNETRDRYREHDAWPFDHLNDEPPAA